MLISREFLKKKKIKIKLGIPNYKIHLKIRRTLRNPLLTFWGLKKLKIRICKSKQAQLCNICGFDPPGSCTLS